MTNRVSLPYGPDTGAEKGERENSMEGTQIFFYLFHFPAKSVLVSVLSRPSSRSSTMQKYKNENKEMKKK